MSGTNKKRVRCLKLNELDECNGGMTLTTALRILPNAPHAANAGVGQPQLGPQANIAPAVQTQVPGLNKNILDQLLANQTTLARQLQTQNNATATALAQARAQAANNVLYNNQAMQLMRLTSLLNQARNSSRYNDPNGYRDTYGSRRGGSRGGGDGFGGGGGGGGGFRSRGGGHSRSGGSHGDSGGASHGGGWGGYRDHAGGGARDRERGGYGSVHKDPSQEVKGNQFPHEAAPEGGATPPLGWQNWGNHRPTSQVVKDITEQEKAREAAAREGFPHEAAPEGGAPRPASTATSTPTGAGDYLVQHLKDWEANNPEKAARLAREDAERAGTPQGFGDDARLSPDDPRMQSFLNDHREAAQTPAEQAYVANHDGLVRAQGEDVGAMHDEGRALMNQAQNGGAVGAPYGALGPQGSLLVDGQPRTTLSDGTDIEGAPWASFQQPSQASAQPQYAADQEADHAWAENQASQLQAEAAQANLDAGNGALYASDEDANAAYEQRVQQFEQNGGPQYSAPGESHASAEPEREQASEPQAAPEPEVIQASAEPEEISNEAPAEMDA